MTLSSALAATVIVLIHYGYSYYSLPNTKRFRSELHRDLKPGGEIGHKLGIAGTVMLTGLLVYSVRKRSNRMKNWGRLSNWLQFHIFLGIAGPILITFHSAFKLRGIVAISYWSMILVALSGAIGRYLYAQIPKAISGKQKESEILKSELEEINAQLSAELEPVLLQKIQKIADFSSEVPASAGKAVLLMLSDDLRWWKKRFQLRRILKHAAGLTAASRKKIYLLARRRALHLRHIALLRASQSLFRYWHIIHIPFAQTMYFTMLIHIFVAVKTGYL
jgi:hypothetical protein